MRAAYFCVTTEAPMALAIIIKKGLRRLIAVLCSVHIMYPACSDFVQTKSYQAAAAEQM